MSRSNKVGLLLMVINTLMMYEIIPRHCSIICSNSLKKDGPIDKNDKIEIIKKTITSIPKIVNILIEPKVIMKYVSDSNTAIGSNNGLINA